MANLVIRQKQKKAHLETSALFNEFGANNVLSGSLGLFVGTRKCNITVRDEKEYTTSAGSASHKEFFSPWESQGIKNETKINTLVNRYSI